ncbi:hypothetical protein [Actinoplanes sp. ATCC 53533]|uniref:hypothetical protein n=1 Tax=Actinoplanes sp. ATCC 53533 TaxID=1288362 RepID=UPI000F792E42|nr:hypothetical protein [Actinoplanes sp. ATCC 53533]
MTGPFHAGAETFLVVAAALGLVGALVAWRTGPVPDLRSFPEAVGGGDRPERLAELRENLDREFLTAAQTLMAVSPGTLAALRSPQRTERVTSAAHRTARYLCAMRGGPSEPWQASACFGQGRTVGLSVVQVQVAALAAARHPDDDALAADLVSALAGLDEAVDGLRLLTEPLAQGGTA